MAAAVASHRSVVARALSPIRPPSCASRVRIKPVCVARPEDAKRQHRRDEEPPRSPPVKRRRRDDPRDASADRRRKRESFSSTDDGKRVSSSGSSFSRIRAALSVTGADVHARCAAKKHEGEGERAQEATRRSGSGSSQSESRARSDPSAAQRQVPAAIERSRSALDRRSPLEKKEVAADAEGKRKRDIQRKREEARREMDKVVRTVEFNDQFISLMDVLKR